MRIFAGEYYISSYLEERLKNLKNEVKEMPPQQLLEYNVDELSEYLIDKYSLEPFHFDLENIEIKEHIARRTLRDPYLDISSESDVHVFTLYITFSGKRELLSYKPSTFAWRATDINLEYTRDSISTSFDLVHLVDDEFLAKKNEVLHGVMINVPHINKDIEQWNATLKKDVKGIILSIIESVKHKQSFFKRMNVSINPSSNAIFTPPVKKAKIPKPVITNPTIADSPTPSKEFYLDVIRIIADVGASLERKPALYNDKDEEALRDHFLTFLETRYDSTTATGETFNKKGKTDILLRYAKDGSNLFIAECKFWYGEKGFVETIEQLIGYLTWRDSMAALMIFVRNKDFSTTITTALTALKKHKQFRLIISKNSESCFIAEYGFPNDSIKTVQLALLMFHFPEV